MYNKTLPDRLGGWPCVRIMSQFEIMKGKGKEMTENHYWFAEQMQMPVDFGLFKEFDVDMTGQDNDKNEMSWKPIEITEGCFKGV